MPEFLNTFFFPTQFIPHGHCYLWKPGLVWLHIVSDSLIALEYYSIPVMLVYFVRKRRDVPFDWLFLMFSIFTIAYATTHLMEVWTLWHPTYWLPGFLKAFTAFASVCTAVLFVPLIPQALALPSPAQLEEVNSQLANEITERKWTEQVLSSLLNELETRVQERTSQLTTINESLEAEIAERNRIEKALRESETQYRRLIETASEGIWILNAEGNTSFANTKMAQMLGYTIEEMMGVHLFAFMDAEGQAIAGENLDRRHRGIAEQHDFKFRCKDGSELWAMLNTNPILDSAGNYVGALGMVTNITDRKLAEDALRNSEERFRLAVLGAPLPIMIHAEDGEVLQISKRWTELTGYSHQDIPTIANWVEKAYGQRQESVKADIQRLYDLNTSVTEGEYMITTRYGESRIWHFSSAPLGKLLDGRSLAIGMAMDVSDRKVVEAQIKASLAEKEVLLKEIHHRVKNNLQIISSLLNLQAEYLKDSEALEIFKVSQQRIESMALIHEKLYQSKDLAKINFAEYIRDLVDSLLSSYEVKSDGITPQIDVDDVFLTIDAAIPCGLIINELVLNSLKYAFPGGKKGQISIGLHASSDDKITLIVSDNGVGLPEGFDFDNTESLGLQLVDALANQLEGVIELNINNGVEFKITFTQ